MKLTKKLGKDMGDMRFMKKAIGTLIVFGFLCGCSNTTTAEYEADLRTLSEEILENSNKAEIILNTYIDVWSFSIKQNSAITVAEMAQVSGLYESEIEVYFYLNDAGNIDDNFSDNVNSLISYYEDNGMINGIEVTANEIKENMTELKDPPEDYTKAYDELLDMYTDSADLVNMLTEPNGTLMTITEDKNNLIKNISSKYERLDVLLPNIN